MRVSVSLSDRIPEQGDWRNSAACRDMDPRDFDDGGTPDGWEACNERCEVRDECEAAAALEQPRGVYQAGRYWPEKYGEEAVRQGDQAGERRQRWLEWAQLAELGMAPPEIAEATGFHRASIINALRRMGLKQRPHSERNVDVALSNDGNQRKIRRAGTVRQHTSGPDRQSLHENERG